VIWLWLAAVYVAFGVGLAVRDCRQVLPFYHEMPRYKAWLAVVLFCVMTALVWPVDVAQRLRMTWWRHRHPWQPSAPNRKPGE
jgi:succinate dehydrogenase/fumarate reductase cytochrome b subunit